MAGTSKEATEKARNRRNGLNILKKPKKMTKRIDEHRRGGRGKR